MYYGRGLGALLVAEMSNAGNLFNSAYTTATVDLGVQNTEVVVGFIAQSRVSKVIYYHRVIRIGSLLSSQWLILGQKCSKKVASFSPFPPHSSFIAPNVPPPPS